MPNIISLTGPSGAGKSTAIELIIKKSSLEFNPVCIPKYTTREKRSDDKFTEVICVKKLPKSCDLVYQQYDARYGLSIKQIVKQLENGYSPIVVLNDIRIIQEIKSIFGDLAKTIFLFRKEPKESDFTALAESRFVIDKNIIQKRLKKGAAIYRIFIENIFLFDYVFLNHDQIEDLEYQIEMLVQSLAHNYVRNTKLV